MLSYSLWYFEPGFCMVGGFGSRCVVHVYRAHVAVCDTKHAHSKHDISSVSQNHHTTKISFQKVTCFNETSNALDDGCMYPKHIELRIHQ